MIYNCYVDVETGGLDPEHNGLTEIAVVPFIIGTGENGMPFVEKTSGFVFNRIIRPEKWLTYSVGALSLQHRTLEELIREGQPECKVYADLIDFLISALGYESWIGRIWAHEATFDWSFIKAMENRHTTGTIPTAQFGKRCDWSCSKFLYRRLAALGIVDNMEEVHLNTVAAHYGIPFEVQHTALGDCVVGIQCLEKILQDEYHYYMQLPIEKIDQHIAYARRDMEANISDAMFFEARAVIAAMQQLRLELTGERLAS